MPDIGATLREARMRQHLDISDIESKTKIRAKYLRALENEEWDLLPGPTFVRSFLRTYAETLDLDARLLLEEYKMRFERLAEHELPPLSPNAPRERARREGRSRRGGIGRDVLVAVFVVALVGVLILLGRGGGSGSDADKVPSSTVSKVTTTKKAVTTTKKKAPAKPPTVAVKFAPHDSTVWVCLRDADKQKTRFVGYVGPTSTLGTYHGTRFKITLGNGGMNLRINGKFVDVPASPSSIGYEISGSGETKRLFGAAQPLCKS